MRPWLADVTLSLLQDAQANATPSLGVEEGIRTMSPPGASQRAFETANEQVDLLAGAPVLDQIASLDGTLRQISKDPQAFSRILDDWSVGDVKALQKDALEPIMEASPRVYRRLITDRNRRWAETLAQRLDGTGEAVVVVGMGHLIGSDGVPALLRAKGFRVSGP
jgi:hypothetical protein